MSDPTNPKPMPESWAQRFATPDEATNAWSARRAAMTPQQLADEATSEAMFEREKLESAARWADYYQREQQLQRKSDEEARSAFLAARIEEMPEPTRPGEREREDLDLRLERKAEAFDLWGGSTPGSVSIARFAVVDHTTGEVLEEAPQAKAFAEVDARAAEDTPAGRLLLEAVKALCARAWDRADAPFPHRPGSVWGVLPPKDYTGPANLPGGPAAWRTPANMREIERLPASLFPPGSFTGIALAFVWPVVFRAWQTERAPGLATRLELARLTDDPLAAGAAARAELSESVAKHLPLLLEAVGHPAVEGADERAAAWLAVLPLRGAEDEATKFRGGQRTTSASERWGDPLYAARFLARRLWRLEVRPRFARPLPVFAPHIVRVGTDRYAKMPKQSAPMAWSFGADRQRAAPAVEVDGERYGSIPDALGGAMLPRSYSLLPSGHEKRPHQTALPMDTGEAPMALSVVVSGSAPYVVSPVAAKLSLLAFSDRRVRGGELVKHTLGGLARELHPRSNRLLKRDLTTSAEALDELRRLFLFLPDGTKVQVFDVQSPAAPDHAEATMPIRFGVTRTFAEALSVRDTPRTTGHELERAYNGEYLINLDGALRLPNNRPAMLRNYIRAAALWNASFLPATGAFDPDRVRFLSLEELAIIANDLPPGVVEYLAADKAGRQRLAERRSDLAKSRKQGREMLEELEATHGLLVVEADGKGGYRLMPTEHHLEAWRKYRAGAGRTGE